MAGTAAMQEADVEGALRHYSQAVGLEPRRPDHRLKLANAYARAGRDEEARKAYLESLSLDSSQHQARYGLAELYAAQNKTNLALDQIARAVELAGDDDAATVYLRKQAAYLRRANRADEALATLQRLPAAARVSPEVSKELADTWTMLDRPSDAARHYEQVLVLDPTADWAAERAAYYRIRAGERDKAAENLATLRRINPRAAGIAELEAALRP